MPEQVTRKERDFVTRSIRAFFPDAEIVAFGSRIGGNARKYSDLDIAIKTAGGLPLKELALLKEKFSSSDIPYLIDILDYHSADPAFQTLIDQTGVRW